MKRNIILFLLCVGLIGCTSGSKKNQQRPPKSIDSLHSEDTLTIMTYNIKHGGYTASDTETGEINLEAIAAVINKYDPDLVALQEVDVNTKRSGKNLNEAEKLGQLTDMHAYFSRAMYYQDGQYGNAVLSRFPIQDSMRYALPTVDGTNEEPRVLGMIKISLPDSTSLYVGSTHLGLSKKTRLLQIKKISNVVQKISTPLIVAGDFNATPGSPAIAQIDRILTRSCQANCKPTSPSSKPSHKIDYVTYRPSNRFKVVDIHVIPNGQASDHRPVLVTLQLK